MCQSSPSRSKNRLGEFRLHFVAERASAPLKHSQEAAGLCRRNLSVRVTKEPTKHEHTRVSGVTLMGDCVGRGKTHLTSMLGSTMSS